MRSERAQRTAARGLYPPRTPHNHTLDIIPHLGVAIREPHPHTRASNGIIVALSSSGGPPAQDKGHSAPTAAKRPMPTRTRWLPLATPSGDHGCKRVAVIVSRGSASMVAN